MTPPRFTRGQSRPSQDEGVSPDTTPPSSPTARIPPRFAGGAMHKLPLVSERGGAPPVAGRGCRWPVQFILIFTPPLHFVQFPPRFARGSTYKKTTYMTWVIYHTKNRIGDIWKVTCPQLLSTTGENYRFRNTRTLASCEPSLRPAIKPSKKNSLDPSK